MQSFRRFLLSACAALFAVQGLRCWLAPDRVAHELGLSASRGLGLVSVRADLGALFLGLAALCALGAWTRRRAALVAAACALAAIVAGRALGWLASGRSALGAPELALELAMLALLAWHWRSAERSGGGAQPWRAGARALAWTAAVVVVLVGGAAAALCTPSVQQAIFDRAAVKMTARVNDAPLAEDALRVAIAGSSAPLPSASRAKASVVVFAGGKFWVVDCGPESVENLMLWGNPMSRIGGVLLTHFHSDHIGDLGELQLQTWAGGREGKLAVYGGPGIETVVEGFNRAYELDQGYRTAHHGERVMPSASWGMTAVTVELDGPRTPAKDRSALVYDDGALRITALEVDHAPIEPAYAYRFDYKGRSVVVTGDLKYHRPLVDGARGADVLVSEAIARDLTRSLERAAHAGGRDRTEAIMHDVQDYHISPQEAAQLANDAGVRHLAFYHLLPAPDGWLMRQLFARGVDAVRPSDWSIADDGALYTLPLGTQAVEVGSIDG